MAEPYTQWESTISSMRWTGLTGAVLLLPLCLTLSGPAQSDDLIQPFECTSHGAASSDKAIEPPSGNLIPACLMSGALHRQIIHQARRIGKESRKIIPKSQYGKFAASGSIECGNGQASAQLVGDNKTITTAGHFFHQSDCQPKNRKSCTFDMFTADGKFNRIPVKMDSLKMGRCPTLNRNRDWAVVQLERPLEGVEPYAIPSDDFAVKENTTILQISGAADNFFIKGDYPRSLEFCRIFEVVVGHDHPIRHDCDTGKGASGSGQYVSVGATLVIISMNVSETTVMAEGTKYIMNINFNVSTPVSGDFLKAIREAMGR